MSCRREIFWRCYEFIEPGQNAFEKELKMLGRVLRLRQAAEQLAWWLAGDISVLLINHFPDFMKRATGS